MTGRQPHRKGTSLTLHRTIDAPLPTVYAAWTDPDLLCRWFAPDDAEVARAVAQVEVGGKFLIEMRGSGGEGFVVRGLYREVVANRRLAHTWCWDGSDEESLVTVEFERESARKTRVTVTHSRFAQAGTRDNHRLGWIGCLAKLEVLCGPTQAGGSR